MPRARVEIKYLVRNRFNTKIVSLEADSRADALTKALRKLPKGIEYKSVSVCWDDEE